MDFLTDIRIRVTETDSHLDPGGRELSAHAYTSHGINLFGDNNPMLAQLGWDDPAGQISDDLTNNAEISDETLALAFGVERQSCEDEAAFGAVREAIENAVCDAVLAAVRLHLATARPQVTAA